MKDWMQSALGALILIPFFGVGVYTLIDMGLDSLWAIVLPGLGIFLVAALLGAGD